MFLFVSCTIGQNPDPIFDEAYDGSAGHDDASLKVDPAQMIAKSESEVFDNQGVEDQLVLISTTKGDIKIKLYPKKAPKTVANFVGLIEKGYYDGIIFHRVIPDFMLQTGDPTGTGRGGESLWGGKFDDEISDLKNVKGSLSMANSGPNTNGSQFFIVQAEETPWLDGKHTVFGIVVEGLDIVDAIAEVKRDRNDKPVEEIAMIKVSMIDAK